MQHETDTALLLKSDLSKVLIFHPEDFDIVSRIRGVDVAVVFCPYLYNQVRVLAPSLKVVFPLQAMGEGGDLWITAEERARKASKVISGVADPLLQTADIDHWQFDYFNFLTLYALRWNEVARGFTQLRLGGELIVPCPDMPWKYGFYSFIPSKIMLHYLRGNPRTRAIPYKSRMPRLLIGIPDVTATPEPLRSHLFYLPATHRHQNILQALINDEPGTLIKAPYYDVDYSCNSAAYLAKPSYTQLRDVCVLFVRQGVPLKKIFNEITEEFFSGIPISGHDMRRQAHLLEHDFVYQILFFLNLRAAFRALDFKTLHISMHHTALHGPLLSFAIERGAKVVVTPHSFVQGMPFPAHSNWSYLSHPLQDYFWDRYHQTFRRTTHWKSLCDSTTRPSRPLAGLELSSILIVLNGTGWSHTCLIDMKKYIFDLNNLITSTRELGLNFSIRAKPNANFSKLIADFIPGIDTQLAHGSEAPLQELFASASLTVCFDSQSSLAIEALENSCPVVFVTAATRDPTMDLNYFDDMLIPKFSLSGLVSQLDQWARDAGNFQKFNLFQRLNYRSKCH